jgi:hypothetical protein
LQKYNFFFNRPKGLAFFYQNITILQRSLCGFAANPHLSPLAFRLIAYSSNAADFILFARGRYQNRIKIEIEP